MNKLQLDKMAETLTKQWYDAVVKACKLDPAHFQLAQGNMGIGMLSEDIWNVLNAIPPKSSSIFYDPSQYNLFSQGYSGVISQLIPKDNGALQNAMGEQAYGEWINYSKQTHDISKEAFKTWVMLNYPGQTEEWYGVYEDTWNHPVMLAQQALIDVRNEPNKDCFAYEKTIATLKYSLLTSSRSHSVLMDSTNAWLGKTNSWTESHSASFHGFFKADGDSLYSGTAQKLVQSKLTAKATFQRLVNFAAGPLAVASKDQTLKKYTPWYNSAALNIGYQSKNNLVWKLGQPDWESTFGPKGNMQRVCSALIVVDGVEVTVTSDAIFSPEEQVEVKSRATAGFFPFFNENEPGSLLNTVSFDATGKGTMSSRSPLGNPTIIGVMVYPITSRLG